MRNELQKTLRYLCVVATLLTVGVWVSIVQRFVEPKPAMAQTKAQTKKSTYYTFINGGPTDLVLSPDSYLLKNEADLQKALNHASKYGFKVVSITHNSYMNQGYVLVVEK